MKKPYWIEGIWLKHNYSTVIGLKHMGGGSCHALFVPGLLDSSSQRWGHLNF